MDKIKILLNKITDLLRKIPKKYVDSMKEIGRWFVLGLLSLYVLSDGDFNLAWALKTISLRIADRLLHIWGKEGEVDWLVKGLTRF